MSNHRSTRRAFLQQTGGALAGAALTTAISQRAYAGEDNTIKIALVGCGGRGNGAVREALQTAGPTRLVAAADFFAEKVSGCVAGLSREALARQVDVPPDRQFVGLDAYRKAIDAVGPGGVVLLATPPAFRPIHLEYAVAKGCHVFMEKSFAVDAPGIRRVLKAGEEAAKKNLKIAGGLRCRHDQPLEEAVALIHKGSSATSSRFGPIASTGPSACGRGRRKSTNWATRSAIIPASRGSTAVSCWTGSSTISISAAGSSRPGLFPPRGMAGGRPAPSPTSSSIIMPWSIRFPMARG